LQLEDKTTWALTFNPIEAKRVADLAEREGCEQIAALLRLLVHRARGVPYRVEELLDPKDGIALAWSILRSAETWTNRQAIYQRQLQKLGGMAGKNLRVPEIYAAVVHKLEEEPDLTPQKFWKSINPDDPTPIYKGKDTAGRPVLKHKSDDERGITLASLRRYFRRARKDLGLSST
jgi:hypothetical protein